MQNDKNFISRKRNENLSQNNSYVCTVTELNPCRNM
jgi:hypothetical protein